VGFALVVSAYWVWPSLYRSTHHNNPIERFITDGETALRRDDPASYEEAISLFTKALAHDERNPRALLGLSRAKALLAQARLFEAEDLERNAEENPSLRGEAAALRKIARQLAEEAKASAESALRAGGGPGAELALADALRLGSEFELARPHLEGVLGQPSLRAEALWVEALLRATKEGPASALPLARQAVELDGELLRARLLLARLALALGNFEDAMRETEAVLARNGSHAMALSIRDQAVLMKAKGTAFAQSATTDPVRALPLPPPNDLPTDYEALIREAENRLQRSQLTRARQLLEAALRIRPNGLEALENLGRLLLAEGRPEEAAQHFRQLLERGHTKALAGLGDALRRLDKRDEAISAYERYLEQFPNATDSDA
ncbi:MAG: tetratricopeptide repeat protein, partial [Deltaproteobacteria bacterium]|nr:tetratricopeptide repeat protein [Deltaproteobacteria bacterium]